MKFAFASASAVAAMIAACGLLCPMDAPAHAQAPNSDRSSADAENSPGDDRLPVPAESRVEAAIALIRDAYEAEYKAATLSGEPEPLFEQLVKLAREETDPVREYAILVEAEALAAKYDDSKRAIDLLNSRAKRFQLDGLALRGQLLKRLASPGIAADLDLYDRAMETAQEASRCERFDVARDAVTLAISVATAIDRAEKREQRRRGKEHAASLAVPPPLGPESIKRGVALQSRIRVREKLFNDYSIALTKEKDSPDSPAANEVIGTYRCFMRGDWESGVPALVKGGDSPFSVIAAEEMRTMAAITREPQEVFTLAGRWWDAARETSLLQEQSEAIKEHACGLYELVFSSLADPLQKRVAESRIKSSPKRHSSPAEQSVAQPLRLAMNGLGGKRYLDPATFGPDWLGFNPPCSGTESAWINEGTFAIPTTSGALAWPAVPASRYVCDFELTFPSRQDDLRLCFGDPWDATQLTFHYVQDRNKFEGRLNNWRHGGWWWWGHHDFEPLKKYRFSLIVGDGRQELLEGGNRLLRLTSWPTDCRLRVIAAGGGTIIHSLSFRPLTPFDARQCGWEMPPSTVDGRPAIAAGRIARLTDGLGDTPVPGKRCKAALVGSPLSWIEPGAFRMGSLRSDDVRSQTVTLTKGFWMGQTEVTQRDYRQVMGVNPSRITGSDYLPVDWVAWEDCEAYCRKLSEAARRAGTLPDGYEYRLPTEAEWEYACRAGSDNEYSVSTESVWDRDRSGRRPREIAESEPNAWGLYDMHGNAMEWCRDRWYDYTGRATLSEVDPYRPGKPTVESFVVRGGAWWDASPLCTSHWRAICTNTPAGGYRGFRIALAPIHHVLLDKTLVTWTTVENLDQRGGGVLSIEDPRTEFDAIVFGEAEPFRWTIGSDAGKRGCPTPELVATEDAKPPQLVQIAIVYSGSSIALYRNGIESVLYEKGPQVPYRVADASVLLGTRHIPIPENGLFEGEVDDARIYDVALTAEQIRQLVPNKITGLQPLAWWHFEDGIIADAIGTFSKAQAYGNVQVRKGRLVLDGRSGFVVCRQATQPALDGLLQEQLVVDFLAPNAEPGHNGIPPKGEALDLLKIADPQRDAVWGTWKRMGEELECGGDPDTRIRFPVRPPRDYEYTVEFTRLAGEECVGQCCTMDGQGFFCMLGGHRNTIAALERLDWRESTNNMSTRRRAVWITNGKRHTSTVRVRRDHIDVLFDGETVISIPIDGARVSYHPAWQIPDIMLGLGTWRSPTRFHRATVKDIEADAVVQDKAIAEPIVGQWKWFVNGAEHPAKVFLPNGEIKNEPGCSWLCVDPRERRYRFVWANGRNTDNLILSADGKALTGRNESGLSITGTRID